MAPVLRSALKVLGAGDVDAALDLCARDPVANLFVAARLFGLRGEPRRPAGEVWGWYDRGELRSVCWSVEATPDAVEAFAQRARRHGRHCSSIVGPAGAVLGMWRHLQSSWGPAREVRAHQPLMAMSGPPRVAPVVSLYVNGYNTRAVRAYQRVGFTTVGTYATILF
jgi:hypothetical protein